MFTIRRAVPYHDQYLLSNAIIIVYVTPYEALLYDVELA